MNILEDKKLILKSIKHLQKKEKSIKQKKKGNLQKLFADDETELGAKVFLVVALIRIPPIPKDGVVQPVTIKSHVPHRFRGKSTSVLLITKDKRGHSSYKKDYEPSIHAIREVLIEHDALDLVTEIMPLKKLKKEFRDFESKRKLASRFDLVLCDELLLKFVPRLLGKPFYKAKKRPIKINLNVTNIRNEIENALSKTYMHMSLVGSSSMVQVGCLNQPTHHLMENILTTVESWREKLPGGWHNVRSVNLKTETSKTIPLYISLTSPEDVPPLSHPTMEPDTVIAVDNINTLRENKVVEVYRSGDVKVVTRPTRANEPEKEAA